MKIVLLIALAAALPPLIALAAYRYVRAGSGDRTEALICAGVVAYFTTAALGGASYALVGR